MLTATNAVHHIYVSCFHEKQRSFRVFFIAIIKNNVKFNDLIMVARFLNTTSPLIFKVSIFGRLCDHGKTILCLVRLLDQVYETVIQSHIQSISLCSHDYSNTLVVCDTI